MKYILTLFFISCITLGFTQDFKTVDAHAKAAPSSAQKSVVDLAQYLNKDGYSDLEKVRSYYVWLSYNIAYDTKTFFSNNPNPKTSASDALKRKKAICQGYSELFKALCDEGNISCFIVSGYSKGYGYNSNKKFTQSDHAWNTVKVGEEWKLIDATWGAGHLNQNKKYEQKFNEKYFLSDPKVFVFDHLPVDPMWQLLSCPLSIDDYKKDKDYITKAIDEKGDCFAFKDTIKAYQLLDPIQQQVISAERAFRFNPKNYSVSGYAYINLAFEISHEMPVLYEAQKYEEALALNQDILKYNERAYYFFKKANDPQSKNAENICKQNIASSKEAIKSLEKFLNP